MQYFFNLGPHSTRFPEEKNSLSVLTQQLLKKLAFHQNKTKMH